MLEAYRCPACLAPHACPVFAPVPCSVPGLYVAGMSMRRGCVMLILDLATSGGGLGSVTPVSALVRALAQAMVASHTTKLLGNGSALTAQVR